METKDLGVIYVHELGGEYRVLRTTSNTERGKCVSLYVITDERMNNEPLDVLVRVAQREHLAQIQNH